MNFASAATTFAAEGTSTGGPTCSTPTISSAPLGSPGPDRSTRPSRPARSLRTTAQRRPARTRPVRNPKTLPSHSGGVRGRGKWRPYAVWSPPPDSGSVPTDAVGACADARHATDPGGAPTGGGICGPPAGGRPETDQAGRAADPALPPGRPRKALVRGRRRAGAHRADRPAGGGAWGHLPRSGQCPGEPGGQDVVRWSTAGRQHGPTDPSAPAHADLGFVPVRAHRVGHGLRAGRDHGETVARRGRAAPGRCRRLFPGPHGRALGLRRRRRRADRGRCGRPDDRGQPAGLASAQGRRATGRERRSARAGRRARPGGDRQPALRPRCGGPGGPVGVRCAAPCRPPPSGCSPRATTW